MPWTFPVSADYWEYEWFFGDWNEAHDYQHKGLDIGAEAGSAIVAPVNFTVSEIGYDADGYGNYVMGFTDDGYLLIFGHMIDTPLVSSGDEVTMGEQIGGVGTTGNSTGPHLHFEIRSGSNPIDPLPFLEGAGEGSGDYEIIPDPGDSGYPGVPGKSGKSGSNPIKSVNEAVKSMAEFVNWIKEIDYKRVFGNIVVVIGGVVLIAIALKSLTTTAAGQAVGSAIGEALKTTKEGESADSA